MADRNISIKVSANVGAYTKSVRSMVLQTERLSRALGDVNRASGNSKAAAQMGAQSYNAMARGAGKAFAEQNRLSAAMTAGNRVMRNVAETTGIVNKGLVSMKSFATSAVAAFGGFLAINAVINTTRRVVSASVGEFIAFEQAMNETYAIIGDLSNEMRGEMVNAARQMAKESTFAASEVADGFFELTQTGLNARQAIAALPAVTRFAQAGMFDLGQATDMLTDVQSAMGLSAQDATENLENMVRVSDTLVRSAQITNATVELMAQAMTNKASTAARLLGKDVEETAAVLAVYAENGVKGRIAGTQLSMAWRDLQTRALKNGDAFRQMGIEVFDSNGKMNHTADIVYDLEVALDGMSNAAARATLMQLGFQDRSLAALMTLIGFSDEIRAFDIDLRNAANTTEEVAKRQLMSLQSRLTLLKHHALDFAIGAGYAFVSFAASVAQKLAPTINALVGYLRKFWDATEFLRSTVLTAAVMGIAVAFNAVVAVVQPLAQLFEAHGQSIGVLATAYGALKLQSLAVTGATRLWGAASTQVSVMTDRLTGSTIRARLAKLQAAAAVGVMRTQLMALQVTGRGTDAQIKGLTSTISAFSTTAATTASVTARIGQSFQRMAPLALAAGMAIKQSWDSVRSEARSAAREFADSFPADTPQGLQAAIDATYEQAQAAEEASSKNRGLGGSLRGAFELMTPFSNSVQKSHETLIAYSRETERLLGLQEGMSTNFARVREEIEATDEVILAAADSLNLDLTKGLEISSVQMEGLIDHLKSQERHLFAATGETERFGDITVEEFDAAAKAAEEMASRIADSLSSFYDVGAAIEAATSEAVDTAGIYSEMYDRREEEAREAASAIREREIQSARDRLEDLRRARQDAETDTKKGYDGQIRALEDHIKNLERMPDAEITFQPPSLNEWHDAIREQTAIRDEFVRKQEEIIRLGAPLSMVDAIKEMGPEQGMALLDEIINGIAQKQQDFHDSMADIPPELRNMFGDANDAVAGFFDEFDQTFAAASELVGFERYKSALEEQAIELQNFQQNLLALMNVQGIDREMVIHLAQSPNNAGVVQDIVDMIGPDGTLGAALTEVNSLGTSIQIMSDDSAAAFTDTLLQFENLMRLIDRFGAEDGIAKYMRETETDLSDVQTLLEKHGSIRDDVQAGLDYLASQEDVALEATNEMHRQFDTFLDSVSTARPELVVAVDFVPARPSDPLTQWAIGGGNSPPGLTLPNPSGITSPRVSSPGAYRNNNSTPVGGDMSRRENGGIDMPGIYSRSQGVIFNEPTAGGEAYIPLGHNKRGRAIPVLRSVAEMFGMSLFEYANGGIHQRGGSRIMGSSPSSGSPAALRIIPVEVPVAMHRENIFNGPINATDVNDLRRKAEQAKRRKNLTGVS